MGDQLWAAPHPASAGRSRRGTLRSHRLLARPHRQVATRPTVYPQLCPGKHSLTKMLPLPPKKGYGDL